MKYIAGGYNLAELADQEYSGLMELHIVYPVDSPYVPLDETLVLLTGMMRTNLIDVVSIKVGVALDNDPTRSAVKIRFNGMPGIGVLLRDTLTIPTTGREGWQLWSVGGISIPGLGTISGTKVAGGLALLALVVVVVKSRK